MGIGVYINQCRAKMLSVIHRNFKCGHRCQVEGKIEVMRGGNIFVGENTVIRRWVCLKPWGGSITIGRNCTINSFSHISGNGGVTIGDNVLIATQCVIVSANHNFNRCDIPIREQGETSAPIVIEDDVWIGAGVKILSGVTIHKGAVIGAGSVVTKDVPSFSVCVGVPAKTLRSRV